jgi:hypothetical protein
MVMRPAFRELFLVHLRVVNPSPAAEAIAVYETGFPSSH